MRKRSIFASFAGTVALLLLASAVAPGVGRGEVAPPSAPSVQEQALRAQLSGTWLADNSAAENQAVIDRAIARCTASMNYLLRGTFSDQLRSNTPNNRRIDLGFPSGNMRVTFDQRYTYTTPPGQTRVFQQDGDDLRVVQRFRNNLLEHVFSTSLGRRWNHYEMLPNGHMRMTAITQGPMMEQPLRFSLTYHKSGG